ncbi:MAG: tRNA pseudouridine(38-40) synthase TruA [Treponema sp.]|jgi:tRNA pseudouridine38-40 synthase|nr:tRNA pseudouridine(38-40) synthase TruA [Treponema sp.]
MSGDSSLRNIRLLISYDGTDFAGWQRQDGQGVRTVQAEIEAALVKLHKRPVDLAGSGRTDAGVHAAGQVANFYTDITGMGAERFVPALNSLLPRDLRILESREAAPSFHARFDASSRTYRYFFISGRRSLPAETRYALVLRKPPQIERLNAYGALLRGEMDCTLFASPADPGKSRRRYIFQACFYWERGLFGPVLVFEISANAFLWKMVRSLAGTLLFYDEREYSPEEFQGIIQSGNRSLAGPTLPPQGLFLWKIDFIPGQRRGSYADPHCR